MYPDIPLPPASVLMHWNTWLVAVEYYFQRYTGIKIIVFELEDKSASFLNAPEFFKDETLRNDFFHIRNNCCFLSHQIKALNDRSTSLNSLKKLKQKLRKQKALLLK